MPVEITEKDKEYDIRAELPGVKKEDLDIDIDKNNITINAKKEEEICEDKKAYKKLMLTKQKLNWNMVY